MKGPLCKGVDGKLNLFFLCLFLIHYILIFDDLLLVNPTLPVLIDFAIGVGFKVLNFIPYNEHRSAFFWLSLLFKYNKKCPRAQVELNWTFFKILYSKVWVKKRAHIQNWPLVKNPHLLSNPHETWSK